MTGVREPPRKHAERHADVCTLVLEPELGDLAWLARKARELSRLAKKRRRRREAQVILSFDESGRLGVRFRPEETPETDDEPEPGQAAGPER